MECPYCKGEMIKGVLSGDGRMPVVFNQGENKKSFLLSMMGDGQVKAAKHTFFSFAIDAFYCGKCKKMIFDTEIQE